MYKKQSHLWGEVIRFTPVALFLVVLTYLGSQAYLSEMSGNLLAAKLISDGEETSAHETESIDNPEDSHSDVPSRTLSSDDALEAVLEVEDLTRSDVTEMEVKYDKQDNRYEVLVETRDLELEVEIDAATGKVLKLERDQIE